MKKFIQLIIMCCLVLSIFIPITALASVGDEQSELQDIHLSKSEFNEITSNNSISTYSTGLIQSHSISVSAKGNKLILAGYTRCISTVAKCGFTNVTIQQKKSSSTSWTEYNTFGDFLKDSSSYTLTKSITVGTGYQYRVSVTHYAKRNIFSTEKINAVSNIVSI